MESVRECLAKNCYWTFQCKRFGLGSTSGVPVFVDTHYHPDAAKFDVGRGEMAARTVQGLM